MTVIVLIIAILLLTYFAGYFIVTSKNYKHNIDAENTKIQTANRIINDQNGITGKSFRYGVHPASFNACEAIAVHNVKVLLGLESRLADILRQFQMSLGMIGYGIGGSNVYMIGRILKKNGIPNRRVKFRELDQIGTYIISYFNYGRILKGIHTVTVTYDGKTYTVYNHHCNGSVNGGLENLDFAKKYVSGFYISNL